MGSKETLENTVNQAISDFDSIEAAIKEKGVDVPKGTDTSEYGDKIRSIRTGVGEDSTVGENNELFNDTDSHTVKGDENTTNNHIEGRENKVIKAHSAYANKDNHVEGSFNIAGGEAGHVEGSRNQTYETRAHAGGIYSVASGAGTMAQGRGVIAMGLGSAATGQSLFTDGSTTVLGFDGEETEIDWTTRSGETEQQRSKRIADRLEGLYVGTELKQDGTPNTSVQRKFLASLGIGNMVGGVNSFARGTANLVHGLGCRSLSSYCFAGGYSTWIGKNSDDCFVFGDNLHIEDNVKDSVLLGTLNTLKAPYSFISGYKCTNEAAALYSYIFGTECYVNVPNAYAFGDHIAIGTKGQFAVGKYNNNESNALFAVGGGTAGARKNVFEVFESYIRINGKKFDGSVPVATSTTSGTVKLYDSWGTNTDGTVTQGLLWGALVNKKDAPIRHYSYTTGNTIKLSNGHEHYVIKNDTSELTITGIPYGEGSSGRVCFRSGATATILNMPADTYSANHILVWKGDDCETGVLVPKANMIYCVDMKGLGEIGNSKYLTIADVTACPYTAN